MSFEKANDNERRESFQQPVRRYFKALDNLADEEYFRFYDETQKIFQHELGLSYSEWLEHDGEADWQLLAKLGLPSKDDYETNQNEAIVKAASLTVSLLGPLVESRVRTFDELWVDFNDTEPQTGSGGIDPRDLELWYLNAGKGAMAIYESYSPHSRSCVEQSLDNNLIGCEQTDSCPVVDLYDQLTTLSAYDETSRSFLSSDEELSLSIYKQKMSTARDIGLISQTDFDNSQRWTK